MTPAERAHHIADQAANRIERQIIRTHWLVTRPGGEVFELVYHEGMTQAEVLAKYPGSGVVPA